ncbi:membrane protein DedA with SNARE-associated domain [Tumebacillus sp. BK434]|uniref:DedA family protein n=1 Tax=Tumebacillus sp. BK434 TaxID=2512169 RepID=UPI001052F2C0|nr:DedA family protein [Tumebacillus sp. BK434]TCP59093.1 membrane protein DedA with SNARE-associated domain [Tumebacillus sp. BK434]
MSVDILLGYIEQYGYFALFFALWLGIVGLPIPDESVVMTGGFVASAGLLHTVPAFLLTYLGVVSGLSLGYLIGWRAGAPILEKIGAKPKGTKHLACAKTLLERYGPAALCISYLLPVVRHIVPYLVGTNKMSFGRYALYSYTSGLVWTVLYFALGYLFGGSIEAIAAAVTSYGMYALYTLLGAGAILLAVRRRRVFWKKNAS